jgi:hypothetical protein
VDLVSDNRQPFECVSDIRIDDSVMDYLGKGDMHDVRENMSLTKEMIDYYNMN